MADTVAIVAHLNQGFGRDPCLNQRAYIYRLLYIRIYCNIIYVKRFCAQAQFFVFAEIPSFSCSNSSKTLLRFADNSRPFQHTCFLTFGYRQLLAIYMYYVLYSNASLCNSQIYTGNNCGEVLRNTYRGGWKFVAGGFEWILLWPCRYMLCPKDVGIPSIAIPWSDHDQSDLKTLHYTVSVQWVVVYSTTHYTCV